MKTWKKKHVAALALTAAFSGNLLAAVSAEEAKQLGGPVLTMWGAEKAGNRDGTIPAYTGDRPKPPASYDPKHPGYRPDPWNEKPLFSITPQNQDKYADKLSEGAKAMLKTYPNFRMDIYPSHRTALFPKYVLDNMAKNATSCKGVDNGLVLSGCYGGTPFPIPKTGLEVIWNHLTRFHLAGWGNMANSWVVDANGNPILQNVAESHQTSPFYDPSHTAPAPANELFWKLRTDTNAPARKAGEKYMILDPVDFLNLGRRVYQYVPGQRRVKLAPDLAYDTPNPVSGGIMTMDQVQLFLGSPDRYDWKLIGKQEKYIMYNNFTMNDYKVCPNKVNLTKNFQNPDCVRWELHRVWVVEATLKKGYRHLLPKRTFYLDEDQTGAGISDDYDASGKVYRVTSNFYFPYYELNGYGNFSDCNSSYDLQTGAWATTCLANTPEAGYVEEKPKHDVYFSPESLAGEGIR